MEWWYYCLGGGVLVLIVGVIILWLSHGSVLPEVADVARKAQQAGATHYYHLASPPGAWIFYRTHGDKLECCFAEYLANGELGWIWEPPNWRECPTPLLPKRPKPISELIVSNVA